MLGNPQARRGGDRGSSTVEIAVLMPVMMLLLMLVIQAALWFHARAIVTTAANKAVDAARVADGTEAAGQQAAGQFLANAAAVREPSIDVSRDPDQATASVTGNVVSLIGFPISVDVSVEAPTETPEP